MHRKILSTGNTFNKITPPRSWSQPAMKNKAMNNCKVKEGRLDLWADLKLGLKQAGQDNMSQTSCKSSRCLSNFPPNEKSQSLSGAQ